MSSEDQEISNETRDAEVADAARSHGADRQPTAEEARAANEAAREVDEADVAVHEREMDELGADVKGEGAI